MTMPFQHFDWSHAKAFWVSAETGSFSAAATQLGVSQPTIGRQVSALEQSLNVSLFERHGNHLTLTETGTALLAHVREMGDAATRLSLTATGHSEEIGGLVCLTASEAISAYLLPPILAELRAAHPAIEIELIASNRSRNLMQREADIAIRSYRPTQGDLIARQVADHPGYLYGTPAYLADFPRRHHPADLTEAQFLGFSRQDQMAEELKQFGFDLSDRNFRLYCDNHLVQWQLVRQGLGLGFMLAEVGDKDPTLVRALPDHPPIIVPTWLVVHREVRTSRRLRLVFDFLAAHLC